MSPGIASINGFPCLSAGCMLTQVICLSLLGGTGYHELDKSYIRPARQVVTPHVHSVFPHLNLPRETY